MRPDKDQYYLNIARVVSSRSTCLKVAIGAIIVNDDQIIASGYVGAPRKTRSSLEHGQCLREKMAIPSGQRYELCRSVHAEQNAIINAARAGVSLYRGTMYIYGEKKPEGIPLNAFPCFICKKMIINAGITRVVCSVDEKGRPHRDFPVDEWVREWQRQDIINDRFQYGNK